MVLRVKKNSNGVTVAILLLTVLIGLHYRLIFAQNITFSNLHNGTEFGHDEFYYIKMARNIVDNGVYGYMTDSVSNAYVTPGYPLFITAFFRSSADNAVERVRIVQAFLSAISIILVFFIGKKISGNKVGLIAAIFVSIYPPLAFYSRFILTETLYIFLFLVYFLVLLITFEKDKFIYHCLSGACFAAAILVRPLVVLLLPLPYVYKFISQRGNVKRNLTGFAAYLIGFILIMLPWWIRNFLSLNEFVFLCTQTNPFYYGIVENYTQLAQPDNELADGVALIIQNFFAQPVQTMKWFTIGKLNIIFGTQDYWVQNGHMYLKSVSLLHYFILAFGTAGVVLAVFDKKIRLISLFIIFTIALQLLFIPVPRYAIPLMPMLSISGAYMLAKTIKKTSN
ncbi:MAG: hypothetical protein GX800_01715 [Clostridiaceae bacterium]|jgi:4-amino-4-deoxy-L-arabinose transferase-like glycosyltransferase|nr:hypothetical protein [Clostridiaceae bacterium]